MEIIFSLMDNGKSSPEGGNMQQLIGDPGKLAMIVAIITALNFFLSGLHKALELIKDKTSSNLDNQADSVVLKIMGVLQILLDWIAPRTIPPPPPPAP